MREKCGEWASVEQYKQRETLSSLLCSASSGLHLPVAAGPPAACSPPPPPAPEELQTLRPDDRVQRGGTLRTEKVTATVGRALASTALCVQHPDARDRSYDQRATYRRGLGWAGGLPRFQKASHVCKLLSSRLAPCTASPVFLPTQSCVSFLQHIY